MKVYIKVFGDVHGVLFRSYTLDFAKRLKLTGWVKNSLDGSVEILAEGEKENLEKLVDWVKTGPKYASVDNVVVDWQKTPREFDSFEVTY